jgi:membrane protease YdiL (CAAX protease family)
MEPTKLDIFTLTTLFILVVAVPLVGIWDFRRLMRWTEEGRQDARIKVYNWILGMEWGMTLGFIAWWFGSGRDLETLGLVPSYHGWGWLALGVGLAASGYMLWQMVTVPGKPKELEKLRGQMGDLSALVPQNAAENRAFSMVSVTAGICEEIVYRGVLMGALIPALGLWPAVAISSVVFGMGHMYQGMAGIVKTTLVGLFMALLTVFSGSLLIAIILHSIIDLTSGRLMAAAANDVGRQEAHNP